MNAPGRKPVVVGEARADPVEVFRLRCASRAKLWHTGQIDLHSAVDELQHSALRRCATTYRAPRKRSRPPTTNTTA